MVGPHSVDWDLFCLGGKHALNLRLWINVALGAIYDPVLMPYISMQSTEAAYRQGNGTEAPAKLLLELLIRCQHRGAKDPRDKIYSLLGLVAVPTKDSTTLLAGQEQSPGTFLALDIRPDYTLPVRDVYSHVACQIMRETGSLDALGACATAAAPELFNNAYRYSGLLDSPVVDLTLDLLLPSWGSRLEQDRPDCCPVTARRARSATYHPRYGAEHISAAIPRRGRRRPTDKPASTSARGHRTCRAGHAAQATSYRSFWGGE